jgi:ribonuclease P protein component
VYPKEQRVKKEKAIAELNKSRYTVKTPLMQLKATKQEEFQIMLVVGKKVFKKAHDRALAKRRMIAVFRSLDLHQTLPKAAYQIRLYNSKIVDYTYLTLQAEMLDGFGKLSKLLTKVA